MAGKCYKCGSILGKYTAVCQKCKAQFLLCNGCRNEIRTSRCPACDATNSKLEISITNISC